MNDLDVKWSYASRDDELEAIKWYLTGQLDRNTKLDLKLGAVVSAYEYLRHAVESPELGRFLLVPKKRTRVDQVINQVISPDPKTGRWLDIPEFPRLPFRELSPRSREIALRFLGAESPAFFPVAITDPKDLGVLKEQSKLAKDAMCSNDVGGVLPYRRLLAFGVDFRASPKTVEEDFKDWLKENQYRFAKDGRSLAGVRARDNPCNESKDLALARLLYLHSFDKIEASKWTWKSQPRDSSGQLIPWYKNRRGGRTRSHVFKDLRDWDRALKRFEEKLETFLAWQ